MKAEQTSTHHNPNGSFGRISQTGSALGGTLARNPDPTNDLYLHDNWISEQRLLLCQSRKVVPLADLRSLPDYFSDEGVRRVRVIAEFSNSNLIVELAGLQQKGLLDTVELCSPLCFPPRVLYADPEVMFVRVALWNPNRPAEGGWHVMTTSELVSYQIDIAGENAEALFREQHPLAAPLMFFNVDVASCARLIGILRDPRWYVDVAKPTSTAEMKSFLDLTPRAQLDLPLKRSPVHQRSVYELVLTAWQGDGPPDDIEAPQSYFWRDRRKYGDNGKGDLHASGRFVRFLRDLWLFLLKGDGQEVMVPKKLFAEASVESAFRDYCSGLKVRIFD